MRGERLARERSSALLKWPRLRAGSVLTGGSFILRYKRVEFGQFGISFEWWLVHFSVLPQRRSHRGRNGLCPTRAQTMPTVSFVLHFDHIVRGECFVEHNMRDQCSNRVNLFSFDHPSCARSHLQLLEKAPGGIPRLLLALWWSFRSVCASCRSVFFHFPHHTCRGRTPRVLWAAAC